MAIKTKLARITTKDGEDKDGSNNNGQRKQWQ